MKELRITKDSANQRLDKFLGKYLNDAPKSFIYKMLRKKNIKLNGGKAQGSEILAEDDVVAVFMADDTIDKFRSEKTVDLYADYIEVVYEDRHVLIVNKPRGLLSHPDGQGDSDTLMGRILAYLHQKGDYDTSKDSVFTPGLCNRLDRNTTGIVVCGKTLAALQQLNRAMNLGQAEKYYLAIVLGEVKKDGTLEGYHSKDGASNTAAIGDDGEKQVITEYAPITVAKGYSLLKIKLVTGRSHQIRAHMASIGHPILGDGKYGGKDAKSMGLPHFQMLHSESISFFGLTFELEGLNGKAFSAPPPKDFIYCKSKLFGGL